MKIISMINKVILSLIISSVVFLTLKESVDINMYATLTVLILILIGINFNMKKSRDMYDTFAAIYLGTTLSFFCIKIIWNINSIDELKKSCLNISWIVVIVVILCILVYLFIGSFMGKSKNSIDLTLELIPKRKNDLERIVEYLTRLNIVCLNAKWGDGKTFLVNNLKEQIKDDYEIIEIDVLSCNLEEIQLVLIKELEKVMIRNRIASKYSKKLSDFLGSEFRFKSMWSINFNENISYLDMINGFKNDLKNLTKKKVLIIYEDIDRIKDMQIIKNIFSISEKISRDTNNIKILYQYDEKNLLDIGFKNDYLEKYMPYKINLTRLNFFEVLKFVLDQMKIEENILKFKDFEFLKYSQQIGNFNIL
ncbi:P-loop NTPase fold protein [Clostridium butyricum]